jgi:hypothetical protein
MAGQIKERHQSSDLNSIGMSWWIDSSMPISVSVLNHKSRLDSGIEAPHHGQHRMNIDDAPPSRIGMLYSSKWD